MTEKAAPVPTPETQRFWDGCADNEDQVPYTIAVIELEEGPRMTTNIVGIDPDPEKLAIGMPLEVTFEKRGQVSVPMFRPAAAGAR